MTDFLERLLIEIKKLDKETFNNGLNPENKIEDTLNGTKRAGI